MSSAKRFANAFTTAFTQAFTEAFLAAYEDSEEQGQTNPKKRASTSFLDWAVQKVWDDHLRQWRAFYERENGRAPGPEPMLDKAMAKLIRDAIRRKDHHLVLAEDKSRFVSESRVRASGIGIFLDPWCTGNSPENNAAEGGKRYLEHWRPWQPQRGKGDPVDKYSPLYFEERDRRRAAANDR